MLSYVVSSKQRQQQQQGNVDTHGDASRRDRVQQQHHHHYYTAPPSATTTTTSLSHSVLATPHEQRGPEDSHGEGKHTLKLVNWERKLHRKTRAPPKPALSSSSNIEEDPNNQESSRRGEELWRDKKVQERGDEREEEKGGKDGGKQEQEDINSALVHGFYEEFATHYSDDDNNNINTFPWVLGETRPSSEEQHGTVGGKSLTGVGVKKSSTAKIEKPLEGNVLYPGVTVHKDMYSVNNQSAVEDNVTQFVRSNNESPNIKKHSGIKPHTFVLVDDTRQYFGEVGGRTCFLAGTNQERTLADTSGDKCWCQVGYFGADCGIPEAAWFSMYKNKFSRHPADPSYCSPSPSLMACLSTTSTPMFEARMHELYDVVDVFIVAESNYTAHGDPKDFNFLNSKGLPLLKGLRDDDLFVLSDADELPTKEVVTFLKGPREALSEVSSAATISMLRDVLYNNAFYIRKSGLWQYYRLAKNLRHYRDQGHYVKEWVVGTSGHYAGWHCSWCFSPENMIRKMDSAQANDIPRWGNYPDKKNITYITSRIRNGIWFDDRLRMLAVRDTGHHDPYYAPRYLLQHPHLYRSILFHPDHQLNLNQAWLPP
ncbi:hypothetical protein Pcinc_043902 [Petrolisthes cinctipes]|uniref:Beta-1,4-mannosyl-glycoprotein 4-beta-N-acetylglucosaminyltransferase n=1 Tax=Petrolisthes cinctipes TaxID=88211 RepID=A0AAE1EEQ1_PETCI|nr:hypothetical protein Pcinc_043902 [Petrolisthes cinctipes]